jgi:hypothetical protein
LKIGGFLKFETRCFEVFLGFELEGFLKFETRCFEVFLGFEIRFFLRFRTWFYWGFSRVEFKEDKRPFKVVATIAKTLNMKSHDNEKKIILIT